MKTKAIMRNVTRNKYETNVGAVDISFSKGQLREVFENPVNLFGKISQTEKISIII